MEIGSRYTPWIDPAVDAFVQEHLNRITTQLLELMGKDLEALILSGGFGRGEGSVLVEDDGHMHIVNDYDFEVVYRQRYGPFFSKLLTHLRYESSLNMLENRLAAELGIKQIDLSLRSEASFAKGGPPRLADYDLKYGHKLLYGERNPVDAMPELESVDIPIFEGTWLLRNRAIGLLLAHFYLQDDGTLASGKDEYFYIEINKALLAMGDALFILNGAYHNAYSVRANRIKNIIPEDFEGAAELATLYTQAAEYKLRPRRIMYETQLPRDLWYRVSDLYQRLFLYLESRRLNLNFSSISDYAEMIDRRQGMTRIQRVRILFDRLRGTTAPEFAYMAHLKADRLRSIAFSFVLLAANRPDGVDARYLKLANRMAGLGNRRNWARLTRDFLMLVHPKGELGRVLRGNGEART